MTSGILHQKKLFLLELRRHICRLILWEKVERKLFYFGNEKTYLSPYSVEKYFAKNYFSSHFTCDPADGLTRGLGEGPAGAAHKVRPEAVAHQVKVGSLHAGRLAQSGQAEPEKRSHVDGVESGLVFCGKVTKYSFAIS